MGALDDPIFDPWSPGYEEEERVVETPPAPGEAEAPAAPYRPAPLPLSASDGAAPTPLPLSARDQATLAAAPRDALGPLGPLGVAERLRKLAWPRLEALARRLHLARHRTSLEDLLYEPTRLIRFELRPWRSPLSATPATGRAVLEIGLGAAVDDQITAWGWLDEVDEAPSMTTSVPCDELTSAWVDRTAVDFVERVLARG